MVLEEIWVTGWFKAEVDGLRVENLVTVVAQELMEYVKGHGDKAVLIILEKSGHAYEPRSAVNM